MEDALPENHPKIAAIYNNIGTVYQSQGDYEKALEYHHKNLNIYKEVLGENYPGTAISYNNIGNVYLKQGKYELALEQHQTALEIKMKVLPKNHSDIAGSYVNIGNVYCNRNNYKLALGYYQKALEIRTKALPENHPYIANSYDNISYVYYKQDKYKLASMEHQKALEIRESALLANNQHDNKYFLFSLDYICVYGFPYELVLKKHQKALEIRMKALPENHPYIANSYDNIGNVYLKQGKYELALEQHQKALEIRKNALLESPPDIANSHNNVGYVRERQGNYELALQSYQRALEVCKESLPENHPKLAVHYIAIKKLIEKLNYPRGSLCQVFYYGLAHIYERGDHYELALKHCLGVLEIREKTLPENHPDVVTSDNVVKELKENLNYPQDSFRKSETREEQRFNDDKEDDGDYASAGGGSAKQKPSSSDAVQASSTTSGRNQNGGKKGSDITVSENPPSNYPPFFKEIENIEAKSKQDTHWFSVDEMGAASKEIAEGYDINIIPNVDAHLFSNGNLSNEEVEARLEEANYEIVSLEWALNQYKSLEKPLALFINLHTEYNAQAQSGTHWVLAFAIKDEDSKVHIRLLDPMAEEGDYYANLLLIQRRINAIFGQNKDIQVKNLGIQTDGDNCGPWVLYMLEQLRGTSSIEEVDGALEAIRISREINIEQKRTEYLEMCKAEAGKGQNRPPVMRMMVIILLLAKGLLGMQQRFLVARQGELVPQLVIRVKTTVTTKVAELPIMKHHQAN